MVPFINQLMNNQPLNVDDMFAKIGLLLTYRSRCNDFEDRYIISADICMYVMKDESVIILQCTQTKKQDISQLIEFLENTGVYTKSTIIYSSISISRPALQYLLSFKGWQIEYIEYELYSFDRMNSYLVPVYTILTEKQIRTIEKRHACPRDKWPKLLTSDPIAKYMGLKQKQCVMYGLDNDFRIVQQ